MDIFRKYYLSKLILLLFVWPCVVMESSSFMKHVRSITQNCFLFTTINIHQGEVFDELKECQKTILNKSMLDTDAVEGLKKCEEEFLKKSIWDDDIVDGLKECQENFLKKSYLDYDTVYELEEAQQDFRFQPLLDTDTVDELKKCQEKFQRKPILDTDTIEKLRKCQEDFQIKSVLDTAMFVSNYVELIVSIGFVRVNQLLQEEFYETPNLFWDSNIEKSIEKIRTQIENDLVPEILHQSTGDNSKKSSPKNITLKQYNKLLQKQDFDKLENAEIEEEMRKREQLMMQVERVAVALMYTLIHRAMREKFDKIKKENDEQEEMMMKNMENSSTEEDKNDGTKKKEDKNNGTKQCKIKKLASIIRKKWLKSKSGRSNSLLRYDKLEERNDEILLRHFNALQYCLTNDNSRIEEDKTNKEKVENDNSREEGVANNNDNKPKEKGVADKAYLPFWVKEAEKAFRKRFEEEKKTLIEIMENENHRNLYNLKKSIDSWEETIIPI